MSLNRAYRTRDKIIVAAKKLTPGFNHDEEPEYIIDEEALFVFSSQVPAYDVLQSLNFEKKKLFWKLTAGHRDRAYCDSAAEELALGGNTDKFSMDELKFIENSAKLGDAKYKKLRHKILENTEPSAFRRELAKEIASIHCARVVSDNGEQLPAVIRSDMDLYKVGHSCIPNTEAVGFMRNGSWRIVLRPIREIAVGELITRSYIEYYLSHDRRRKTLKDIGINNCQCRACGPQDPEFVEKSSRRREKLESLNNAAQKDARRRKHGYEYELYKEHLSPSIQLLEEEELGNSLEVAHTHGQAYDLLANIEPDSDLFKSAKGPPEVTFEQIDKLIEEHMIEAKRIALCSAGLECPLTQRYIHDQTMYYLRNPNNGLQVEHAHASNSDENAGLVAPDHERETADSATKHLKSPGPDGPGSNKLADELIKILKDKGAEVSDDAKDLIGTHLVPLMGSMRVNPEDSKQ